VTTLHPGVGAPEHPKADRPLDASTDLAFERSRLASERTLMAWIRTSLSMISFGFTIYKFFEYLGESAGGTEPRHGPLNLGRVMVMPSPSRRRPMTWSGWDGTSRRGR